jgi:hypothetical protein
MLLMPHFLQIMASIDRVVLADYQDRTSDRASVSSEEVDSDGTVPSPTPLAGLASLRVPGAAANAVVAVSNLS